MRRLSHLSNERAYRNLQTSLDDGITGGPVLPPDLPKISMRLFANRLILLGALIVGLRPR
jgi:hypothetical protein